MRNKGVVLLLLITSVSVSLMTLQSMRGELKPLNALRTPIYKGLEFVDSICQSIKSPLLYLSDIKNQNLRYKREIEKLKIIEQEYRELRLENQRLGKILDLKRRSPLSFMVARVIFKGIRQWPRIFIIDKGTEEGIKKDLAVRTAEGLIGKVIDVMPESSIVLLLTDVDFSVSVRLQDTRVEGVLTGRGDGLCSLKYIPSDTRIDIGSLLVTSGLDNLFPRGIPVGVITGVSKGDELFQNIEVEPIVNSSVIEEVIVVKR
jgi:rod shape-determining protein MreC